MHAGSDQETLDTLLAKLNELRKEYGREREPFEIHVISLEAYSPDGIRRLEEAGISDVIVGFRDVYAGQEMPLQQKIDALQHYADDIILKTRG